MNPQTKSSESVHVDDNISAYGVAPFTVTESP